MCKQVADTDRSINGHWCSSSILVMPVYVMLAVDYSPTLSYYNQIQSANC